MSIKEYIKKLEDEKKRAEARFTDISVIEQDMIDAGYDFLVANLDVKGDVLDVPKNFASLMDGFITSILKIANSKPYEKILNNYLGDLETIRKNIEAFQKDYNSIALNKPGIKNVQKVVIDEIINQYSENGLNTHFAAPLRDLIYNQVLGGMSQKEARLFLKDYIKGGKDESGKLSRYLTQTAQQGVDSYTGATNMKINKEFEMTGYIISGSIIETSSTQCRKAIEMSKAGYLTFKEWEGILEIARNNGKARLIDGTTIDNLPLNKLHWGCRHEFTIVYKEPEKPAAPAAPKPKPAPKPTPKPAPKPVVKEPVKTIADIEKEIMDTGLVLKADFSKLKPETAAKVVSTVKDMYSKFDLKGIRLESTTTGNFTARAHGGMIEVHGTNILKKEEGAKIYQENKATHIRLLETAIKNRKENLSGVEDKALKDFYTKDLKRLEKELEKHQKFTRWIVDTTEEGTIIHEFGHVIHEHRSGFLKSGMMKREFSVDAKDLNEEWYTLYSKIKGSEEQYKLSEYGMENLYEMFAESFVLYVKDRKKELPRGIEAYLDKYLKGIKK